MSLATLLSEIDTPEEPSADATSPEAPESQLPKFDIEKLIREYREPEWEFKGVTFYFEEIPATKSNHILNALREVLMPRALRYGAEVFMANPVMQIIVAFLSLPVNEKNAIRKSMFKWVKFAKEGTNGKYPLAADMDVAFNGLGPYAIEVVFMRSLVVNFMSSSSMTEVLGISGG